MYRIELVITDKCWINYKKNVTFIVSSRIIKKLLKLFIFT